MQRSQVMKEGKVCKSNMGRRPIWITCTDWQHLHHVRSICGKPTQTHIQPIHTKINLQEQTLPETQTKPQIQRKTIQALVQQRERYQNPERKKHKKSVEPKKQKGKRLISTRGKTSLCTHISPKYIQHTKQEEQKRTTTALSRRPKGNSNIRKRTHAQTNAHKSRCRTNYSR